MVPPELLKKLAGVYDTQPRNVHALYVPMPKSAPYAVTCPCDNTRFDLTDYAYDGQVRIVFYAGKCPGCGRVWWVSG